MYNYSCCIELAASDCYVPNNKNKNYKNKNWLQFLFFVKAAALKKQISKFYLQIQYTKANITFISVSGLS